MVKQPNSETRGSSPRLLKDLESIRIQVDGLMVERDQLREQIRRIHAPKANDSAVAVALRKALANEVGWRENARQVLGDYAMIACLLCGEMFPSGGARKKTCGKHSASELTRYWMNVDAPQ